jgi:hypothetical protein
LKIKSEFHRPRKRDAVFLRKAQQGASPAPVADRETAKKECWNNRPNSPFASMSATLARVEDGHGGGMAMQFTRVVSPVEDMEIWNASGDGFSFVISHESRSGPGFHGPPGYVASWRSLSQNTAAIRVGGSPFKTLAEAEEACKAILGYLTKNPDGG